MIQLILFKKYLTIIYDNFWIFRCLQFSDKGDILYGSGNDFLGVYGVEPTRVCDSVDIKWGNLNEFVVKDNRIVSKYTIYDKI